MGFRSSILAGTRLVRQAIQSPDYVPGVSGWSINRDGSAEFNDATTRGELRVGDATDYVEVTADPSAHIEFGTSSVVVDQPGWIGFEDVGSGSFVVRAPHFVGQVGYSELSFSQNFGVLRVVGGVAMLQSLTGSARVAGTSVYLGTDTDTDTARVTIDPATKTVRTYGRDRGKGLLDYTPVQASTALSASEAIGITSDTVDFEVGRAYELTLHYRGSGNTANDAIGFRMRRTNLAGTSLYDSLDTHNLRGASAIVNGEVSQICVNNTGSTLSTVIVGSVYRRAGAGTVQWFANAANPSWIRIKDVGLAADYPNARSL